MQSNVFLLQHSISAPLQLRMSTEKTLNTIYEGTSVPYSQHIKCEITNLCLPDFFTRLPMSIIWTSTLGGGSGGRGGA